MKMIIINGNENQRFSHWTNSFKSIKFTKMLWSSQVKLHEMMKQINNDKLTVKGTLILIIINSHQHNTWIGNESIYQNQHKI
jgi:hypothetical protein